MRSAGLAAALAAGAIAALAGCGNAGEPSSTVTGVGSVRTGSVAQLAQCHDWVDGTRAERIATIHDIRSSLNQAGGLEPTSDLNDTRAYDLLQRACANDFASGFRLYKLYARAAAFKRLGYPQSP